MAEPEVHRTRIKTATEKRNNTRLSRVDFRVALPRHVDAVEELAGIVRHILRRLLDVGRRARSATPRWCVDVDVVSRKLDLILDINSPHVLGTVADRRASPAAQASRQGSCGSRRS